MGAIIEIKYFNSFLLKKINESSASQIPSWNGSFGIPVSKGGYPQIVIVTGKHAGKENTKDPLLIYNGTV